MEHALLTGLMSFFRGVVYAASPCLAISTENFFFLDSEGIFNSMVLWVPASFWLEGHCCYLVKISVYPLHDSPIKGLSDDSTLKNVNAKDLGLL